MGNPSQNPEPRDRMLDGRPEQDHVSRRDLTSWHTALGQRIATLAVRSTRRFLPRRSTPAGGDLRGSWSSGRSGAEAAAGQLPQSLLWVTLLVGLLIVGVLTVLAAGVYDAVTESDGISGLDRPALDVAVASRTPVGNRLIAAYSSLGGTVGMPLLAAGVALLLAWRWRQWIPVILIAATAAGSLLLTVVGKAVVGRTRPPLSAAVPPLEHSASFPSGHSLNAAAIVGVVAYLLVQRQERARTRVLTVVLAGAFVLTMGLSRVYLGHHWLTDVLVAWSLGFAWLAAVVTAHRMFLTARRQGVVEASRQHY